MESVPDLLTVEEAARILRIGRTKAYAMTKQWRASDGREGLSVVDVGGTLRVPRVAVEELIGSPILCIPEADATPDVTADDEKLVTATPTTEARPKSRTKPKRRNPKIPAANGSQQSLPFTE